MRSMKLAVIGLAAALAFPSLSAAYDPHSFREEVAVLGMGGAYTAGGWRGSALFYNPATLALKPFNLNIPIRIEGGAVGGFSQVKDTFDYFKENKDKLENINNLPTDEVEELEAQANELDGKGMVIRAMPAFRLGFRHFAIQSYMNADGSPQMNSGVFQPRLDLNSMADAGIIVGYGRQLGRFEHTYVGASMKYFNRWYIYRSYSLSEAAAGPEADDIISDLKDRQTGLGFDFGLLHQRSKWAFGLQAQDALTFGKVQPDLALNAGFRYRMFERLNLVADYRDILNSGDVPLPMHLHFGGELDLTLLRLRAGAYQGYPTVGLGVNLWLIKVDAVYYGRERGMKLGYEPEDNLAVEVQIGLD